MFPLALRTVGSRIGPWLGRIARQSPDILRKFADKLRRGGAAVGTSAGEIAEWVKANPANAALAVATAASLGMSVKELLDSSASDAPELMGQLDAVMSAARLSPAEADQAAKRLMKSGALSEELNLAIAESKVDRKIAIAVLGWAKSHYGSAEAAARAHKLHQAFFEMPLDDVMAGFADFDLSANKVAVAIRDLEQAAM